MKRQAESDSVGEPIITGGGREARRIVDLVLGASVDLPDRAFGIPDRSIGYYFGIGLDHFARWDDMHDRLIAKAVELVDASGAASLPHAPSGELHAPDKPSGGELREELTEYADYFADRDKSVEVSPARATRLSKLLRKAAALLPNQQRVEELEGALREIERIDNDVSLSAGSVLARIRQMVRSALNPTKG